MKILMGLLAVLLCVINEVAIATSSPGEIRESGECPPDTRPQSWALSATADWVVWDCQYSGPGLVDDLSRHDRVFLAPAGGQASASLSILARDWSVAPAGDALWYVDEEGTVRRLALPPTGELLSGKAKTAGPGLDLASAEAWPILGLSATTAVVALSNAEGPRSICTIRDDDTGLELQECVPSAADLYWAGSSPISASAFAVMNRLGDWSYSIEHWQVDPLARRWVKNLPFGIQPRGIVPGRGGEFLVVGCVSEAPNPPFLAVFDSAGAMEVIDSTSESCTFGLLNPCPAVVGGVWEDKKWRVWFEPGPSGDAEEVHVDTSGAECFPRARPNNGQGVDLKPQ